MIIAALALVIGMPLALLGIACWTIARHGIAIEQSGAMD